MKVFKSVEDLKLATLSSGSVVMAMSSSDPVKYNITDSLDIDDAGVQIANGNYAVPAGLRVDYKMFGAVGDGAANDYEAIESCHKHANHNFKEVYNRDSSDVYYFEVPEELNTVSVKTNWKMNGATFRLGQKSGYPASPTSPVFQIDSRKELVEFTQEQIDDINNNYLDNFKAGSTVLPPSLFAQYKGAFAVIEGGFDIFRSSGAPLSKKDMTQIQKNGTLISPLNLDYQDGIVSVTIRENDDQGYLEFSGVTWWLDGVEDIRALYVRRNMVRVKDMIVKEPNGTPLTTNVRTFFAPVYCQDVQFENIHGEAWDQTNPPNGTYLFGGNNLYNIAWINCTGNKGWGASGLNYIRRFIFDNCALNRYDVHWGAWDGTFKKCIMNNWGILICGGGSLLVEDCDFVLAATTGIPGDSPQWSLILTRVDYGGDFRGDVTVNDCRIRIASDFNLPLADNVSIFRCKYSTSVDYGRAVYHGHSVTINNIRIFQEYGEDFTDNTKNIVMVNYDFLASTVNDTYVPHTITINDVSFDKQYPDIFVQALRPHKHYKDTIKAWADAPDIAKGDYNGIVSISNFTQSINKKTALDDDTRELVKFGGDLSDADPGWQTRADAWRPKIRVRNVDGLVIHGAVNATWEIRDCLIYRIKDIAVQRPDYSIWHIKDCDVRFLGGVTFRYLPVRSWWDSNRWVQFWDDAGTSPVSFDFSAQGVTIYGKRNIKGAGFTSTNDPSGFFETGYIP